VSVCVRPIAPHPRLGGRNRPKVDADRTGSHHIGVKRALLLVLAGASFCVACSNGEANKSELSNNPTVDFNVTAPVVPLTGRVTDAAHILSPEQVSRLTVKLEQLERTTKHQLVVTTVPSLGGLDVADFTRDLANKWGIGRKGYNDGVVLLVAPNEMKVRIAVGYGLERTLTQEVCQQIIDRSMLPRLRKGDLPGGIEAGTDALIARLS